MLMAMLLIYATVSQQLCKQQLYTVGDSSGKCGPI